VQQQQVVFHSSFGGAHEPAQQGQGQAGQEAARSEAGRARDRGSEGGASAPLSAEGAGRRAHQEAFPEADGREQGAPRAPDRGRRRAGP